MEIASLGAACVPSTFAQISVPGIELLSIQASLVINYSGSSPGMLRFTQPSVELKDATFCNVTITYTHPSDGDSVNVEAWLPAEGWNGRLQAIGGGGFVAGRFPMTYASMIGALADGYATMSTDLGVVTVPEVPPAWILDGRTDIRNFGGSATLNEEAIIGKSVVRSFYGRGPSYSYWNGCSQGGRQGMVLAQEVPTAYDGIAVGAPALYLPEVLSSVFWPQQYMNEIGEYPAPCEVKFIVAAAIAKCDGLDGLVDGVVSDNEACLAIFNPFDAVGETIDCVDTGGRVTVSEAAAQVLNATWTGIVSATGEHLWHGFNTDSVYINPGPLGTNCTDGTCIGAANNLGAFWVRYFLAKDPEFDYKSLTRQQWDDLIKQASREYGVYVDTAEPDLSSFREAGGKMLMFHGLADPIISIRGTEQYYRRVSAVTPDTQGFFRYFPVPGLGHCLGGASTAPYSLFDQLRAWVENGTAPETTTITYTASDGSTQDRTLCPWPKEPKLGTSCTDPGKPECWSCVDSGAAKKPFEFLGLSERNRASGACLSRSGLQCWWAQISSRFASYQRLLGLGGNSESFPSQGDRVLAGNKEL